MKNCNGKRPSFGVTTSLPPNADQDVVPQLPQNKRAKYEETIFELLEGPRKWVPMMKPEFDKGVVKKATCCKKQKKN